MPGKKGGNRATARKGTVKRTKKNRNPVGKISTLMPQTSTLNVGFPLNYKCKLRYVDNRNFTVASGAIWRLRLNSLFDPDFTYTGHQPMFYDQLSIIYNEYLVTSANISFTCNQDNSTDYPSIVMLAIRDNSTLTSTTISSSLEQGNRTVMQLGYAGGGDPNKTMSQKVSIGPLHGVKRRLSPADIDFTSLTNNNPKEEAYAMLQMFSADETTGISMDVTVTIDYYCQFFNRKEVAQS